MPEQINIITALSLCKADPDCGDCPYKDEGLGTCESLATLHADALALITDIEAQLVKAWEDNGKLLRERRHEHGRVGENV